LERVFGAWRGRKLRVEIGGGFDGLVGGLMIVGVCPNIPVPGEIVLLISVWCVSSWRGLEGGSDIDLSVFVVGLWVSYILEMISVGVGGGTFIGEGAGWHNEMKPGKGGGFEETSGDCIG
jgi:hypothetical protein